MFQSIDFGQPGTSPISSVVKKGDLVYTVQIPTDPDTGDLVDGGIEAQSKKVFDNLRLAMEASGGSLGDVMLVQIYIVAPEDWAPMHRIWSETFKAPFPSRATVVVKELMLPGMLIEIVASAHLG